MIDYVAIFLTVIFISHFLQFAINCVLYYRLIHWRRQAMIYERAFWSGRTCKDLERAVMSELAKSNGKIKARTERSERDDA